MHPCASCEFKGRTFNELIEHEQRSHTKVIDPGAEFSAPKSNKLKDVIDWVRKHPDCTLKSGEAKLLLDEIDRLENIRVTALKAAEKLEAIIQREQFGRNMT